MAVTESDLEEALRRLGLVERLSAVADRNPVPPRSGEYERQRVARRRDKARRELVALQDQALAALGEIRRAEDELRLLSAE